MPTRTCSLCASTARPKARPVCSVIRCPALLTRRAAADGVDEVAEADAELPQEALNDVAAELSGKPVAPADALDVLEEALRATDVPDDFEDEDAAEGEADDGGAAGADAPAAPSLPQPTTAPAPPPASTVKFPLWYVTKSRGKVRSPVACAGPRSLTRQRRR